MRTPILVIVISLLAALGTSIGRNRKVTSSRGNGESLVAHLNTLTAEQLQRICNQQIVTQGEPFFYNWVIRNVLNHPFARPSQVSGDVGKTVKDHLDQLNGYIAAMTELSRDLSKFSRFYFDASVKDLNSRAYEVLQMDFKNVYDTREKLNELTPKVGPYAENLIQEISERNVGVLEIQTIGDVYRSEDQHPQEPIDLELHGMVEENKPRIKDALYRIIAVYTNTDPHKIYPTLTPQQKDFLETYFHTFKYLLDPVEHHRAVLKALTNTGLETGVWEHPFINQELFGYFQGLNTPYKPIFFRDNFIAKFNPDYALEDLRAASDPTFFSWDFFKAFEGIHYADARDPSIEDTKSDRNIDKVNRKIARLHAMLYKVYTFARDDNTLPYNHHDFNPEDNQAILRRLYAWVKDRAPLFAVPELTEEGLLNPGQKLHTLFVPQTFRRYYLPLLDLICQKIHGCDILKDDKEVVVKTFVDFGNHDDLKENALVKQLISPKLLDEIILEAGVKELKDFGDKVEDLIDKMEADVPSLLEEDVYPDDFEQMETVKKTPKKTLIKKKLNPPKTYGNLPLDLSRSDSEEIASPTLTPKKVLKDQPLKKEDKDFEPDLQKVKPLTPKQLQDEFDNTIGKRFLPKEDEKPEEETKKVVQLTKFLDSVDAIENAKKKRKIRHLLMNFIIKSHSKPLTEKFVEHKMKQLRSPVDFGNSVGFRNFLFRTMNPRGRYVPTSADDEYNYGLDVLFYIVFASKDYVLNLKTTNPQLLKTEGPKIGAQLSTLQNDFILAPPVGLSGDAIKHFQDARSALLTKPLDEKFLERSSGVEFFRNFLDFFDYYEKIEKDPKAVNVDYYRVYLQFYQILAHLRRGDIQAFENPHEYVLLKIQECMIITDAQEAIVPLSQLRTHCVFSYRKYAEVLYFYKMYLLQTNKRVGRALLEFEHGFDVHTRMFISFAAQNLAFSTTLNLNCETNPDLHAICTSWNTFKAVTGYVRNENMLEHDLNGQLAAIAAGTPASKINMFNGFEAAFFFNGHSNVAQNYKLNKLFATEGVDTNEGVGQLLKFVADDEQALTLYLSRTYKKLTLEASELKIFDFVSQVLASEETGQVGSDVLINYLYFIDRVAPFHVKIFLQYAQTEAHFGRIARVLINNDISTNLIAINDPAKDEFFRGLVADVSKLPQEKVAMHVFDTFQKEYMNTLKQCKSVAEDSLLKFLGDPTLLDALGLSDQQETEKKSSEELGQEIVRVLETVQTRIQISDSDNIEDLLKKHEEKLRSEIMAEDDERISIEVQEYDVITDGEEEFEDDDEELEEIDYPFERQYTNVVSERLTSQVSDNVGHLARTEESNNLPAINEHEIPVNENLLRLRQTVNRLRRNRAPLARRPIHHRRVKLQKNKEAAKMDSDKLKNILKGAKREYDKRKPKPIGYGHKFVV